MRIVFVIPTIGGGGAERVACLLCADWVTQGHSVGMFTFEAPNAPRTYALDDRVMYRAIDARNSDRGLLTRIATNFRRVYRLRLAIKNFAPDIIVAFTTEANVVALWATRGLRIPVIISERNQPDRPGLGIVSRLARRLTYPTAASIVVQTEQIRLWARRHFSVPIHVIPNPVGVARQNRSCASAASRKRLVAAGRLVRQKGFDLLIDSFSQIARRHPDWTLYIYGEGPDRPALQRQISVLGLNGQVILPGFEFDFHRVLAEADIFVLSSRYEGYPNVLIEALAAGCAVVATNCPGATGEILRDGHYGLIVANESVGDLAAGLNRMLSDETLRGSYARRAPEMVRQLGGVGKLWLSLMADATGNFVKGKHNKMEG